MLKVKTFMIGPIETNCYLAYDGETGEGILIDPAEFDEKITGFIKDNSVTVKFIVNTHGHYDHIGGNRDFGYPVLIHEEDKDCLSNPMRNLSLVSGTLVPATKSHRLLRDNDTVEVRGLSFKVLHTPGHTPGGISLECEDSLFTGDTLFCESIGRTDIPFSNQRQMDRSLARLMVYGDDVKVYPGHGRESTIGYERKYNPFLSGPSEKI